jgi:cell wall-associated NlpC family hydrolase
MDRRIPSALLAIAGFCLLLAGCGTAPPTRSTVPSGRVGDARLPVSERAREVVLFALGLIETDYRFGGRNPEAGLDCSGMVSYVFNNAAGIRLSGSAADIARRGRPVELAELRPGDLVFFNTLNRPRSHVGIYIGDGRFIHAPASRGKVRTDALTEGWFATRFEEARTYLD